MAIDIDKMADRYIKAGLKEIQEKWEEELDMIGINTLDAYYNSYDESDGRSGLYQRHYGDGGFLGSYKTKHRINSAKGHYYGNYWVEFSPKYMDEVYYEYPKKGEKGHGAPLSKETVFSWNFEYGRHGYNPKAHSWIYGNFSGAKYIPEANAYSMFEEKKKDFDKLAGEVLDKYHTALMDDLMEQIKDEIKKSPRFNKI